MKIHYPSGARTSAKCTALLSLFLLLAAAHTPLLAEVPDPDFFDGSIQAASQDPSEANTTSTAQEENSTAKPSDLGSGNGETAASDAKGSGANTAESEAKPSRVFEEFKVGGGQSSTIKVPQSKPDANARPASEPPKPKQDKPASAEQQPVPPSKPSSGNDPSQSIPQGL